MRKDIKRCNALYKCSALRSSYVGATGQSPLRSKHFKLDLFSPFPNRTRARSGKIDLFLRRLGIQLRGADAAVVEEALHLVDGNPFTEHLRRPPMAKIMRMDMRQAQFSRSIVDHAPDSVGGKRLATVLGPRARMAHKKSCCTGVVP